MSYFPFQDFDRRRPFRIYWKALPHWRQDGATYFVTFRLADSIPAAVLALWKSEQEAWLRSHGITDQVAKSRDALYLQIPKPERTAFERQNVRKYLLELDKCQGDCQLRGPEAQNSVRNALLYFEGSRLKSGDFIVMPNHVHWLVLPFPGHELEDILKSTKRFSANEINRQRGQSGELWQKDSFDHLVRDRKGLERYREYIANNGKKAGLRSDEYTYFRADWP